MTKLEIDLRSFFLTCEISRFDKQKDFIVYTVPPAYIDSAVKRANEIIKIKKLNLVAVKQTIVNDKFVVQAA